MASGKQRRGPKPTPRASKRPGPSAAPRPPRGAPARRGVAWQWWVVIGVVVVAIVIGVVVQSNRSKSENTKVVAPKHALGPNDSEIEGAGSAKVLVQEYADFQCPSCRAFHAEMAPTIEALVKSGQIRFAYTYFPFIGDESVQAAAAAVCAGDQGKFFPFADLLYDQQRPENSGFLTTTRLLAFGRQAGITGPAYDAFEKCVKAKTYEGFVRRSADQASQRGVNQTPTLFISGPNGKAVQMNDEQISSPAAFKQAVADAAAGKT
ncbi:MAG TPA: thioredoxin domain-containing protein [Acidimicrobiia bacterium]|jgi:protein-disulfide isomerase